MSRWLIAVVASLGCCFASGCHVPGADYPRVYSTALENPETTTLGRMFVDEIAEHPGDTGCLLLEGSRLSFQARLAMIELAEKTLDVQYFIWSSDIAGSTLGDHLIRAADRGVRVRFLLDDHKFTGRDHNAAAAAAHPNIEIRIFNPHAARRFRTANMLVDLKRLNHRMHNKIMVADNACAIVGGRNVADEYFGLDKKYNNRDMDVLTVGPATSTISASFDRFWNSSVAIPAEALTRKTYDLDDFRERLAKSRAKLAKKTTPYKIDLTLPELRERMAGIESSLVWAPVRVVEDEVEKVTSSGAEGAMVVDFLNDQARQTEHELLLESAYLVTTEAGVAFVRGLVERGVAVRVLTNSLASNNVLPAHAGHAMRRDDLVEAGAAVYELRPDAAYMAEQVVPAVRGAKSTLHTKVMVFDRKRCFVGSYNLDPRSAYINTEFGLLIESDVIARQLAAFMDRGVLPENAYQLSVTDKGKLRWETQVDGATRQWKHDPESSLFERWAAWFIKQLPIESQL